jgi:hypothetical protein
LEKERFALGAVLPQLSSNQIANWQADLPQLQLHQIVIAPAGSGKFHKNQ